MLINHTGYTKVGGFNKVMLNYPDAINNVTKYYSYYPDPNISFASCGYPPSNWDHIFRSPDDPNYPWPGIIFGLTISSVWYWCSDQVDLLPTNQFVLSFQ